MVEIFGLVHESSRDGHDAPADSYGNRTSAPVDIIPGRINRSLILVLRLIFLVKDRSCACIAISRHRK